MSQGTNEKEWESRIDNLIIDDIIQKENITYYQYSEFQNVKLITTNIFKASFKISQKIVALKCVSLNDKFTLDNFLNEIKRHRKLEIRDSILKFYGITKQENTNNYMIILEYANEGSLRQYLKINFQSLDWNTKLNLAKQIANVLMFLHSNDIVHGKLNSENILIHNGIIKLNVFGLIKIISDSLSFLIKNIVPIQCVDPQQLELFNTIGKNKSSDIFGLGIILWEISSGSPPFEMESLSNVDLLNYIVKERKEMAIPGTPHKYKEIYTDCWRHDGNSRPDISQVVKNLSEIIIRDATVCYVNGFGIEKNEKKGFETYLISAEKGFLEAQSNVNACYQHGTGITKDDAKGFQWIIKSALAGNIRALHNVGWRYYKGISVDKDEKEAFKWYLKAAEKEYNVSQHNLGCCYRYGEGIDRDYTKAFEWFKKAAENNYVDSQYVTGKCFYEGRGTKKDIVNAIYWLNKAKENGNTYANALLERIISNMM
ncbi:hypothetical protein Glove_52g34 [Diversispora epigaea]|uniref:Protein kinase domain-containing protein n=1 Tax=Diversispora epigaea TaxID=1348612 RepID=A0A397JM71_9GLOM|nr:hypothetical protein Glove_52g34 [Diversispora epigaea]